MGGLLVLFSHYFLETQIIFFQQNLPRSREYFEQAGIPQGPAEAEETDPFQATREAMKLGLSSGGQQFWKWILIGF